MQSSLMKMQEIADRGLQDKLPQDKRLIFDEAVSRGLIKTKEVAPQIQPMAAHAQPEAMSSHEAQTPQLKQTGFAADFFSSQGVTPENSKGSVGQELRGLVDTGRAARNVPGDLKSIAYDLKTLVTDFPEVVKGVGMVAKGVYNTATSGETDPVLAQIAQAAQDKYGSIEKFQEAFETEPANTIMLVGAASGLLGGAVKIAGKASGIPALVSAGEKGLMAGTAVDVPTQAAKLAGKAVAPVARNIMEGVTKFGTAMSRPERNKLIDVMFKYNILPNETGVNKVWEMIEQKGGQVSGLIDEATAAGKAIPKKELFKRMGKTIDNAWNKGDMPIQNRDQVRRVIQQWNARLKNVDELTPTQAQEFKQGIYKAVNYDRKAGKSKPMFTEMAKKDFARGLKEELEKVVPDLKHINADEGELLALTTPLMKAANRIGNHNSFSMGHFLGGSAAGGIAGALTGSGEAGGIAFFLGAIAADPRLQSKFSMLLNKASRSAEKVKTGGAVGVGVQQSAGGSRLAENGN